MLHTVQYLQNNFLQNSLSSARVALENYLACVERDQTRSITEVHANERINTQPQ